MTLRGGHRPDDGLDTDIGWLTWANPVELMFKDVDADPDAGQVGNGIGLELGRDQGLELGRKEGLLETIQLLRQLAGEEEGSTSDLRQRSLEELTALQAELQQWLRGREEG